MINEKTIVAPEQRECGLVKRGFWLRLLFDVLFDGDRPPA